MNNLLTLRGCIPIQRFALLFLVLTCCFAASLAYAQEADQSTQTMQSYEGQNVSSLEIAGQPGLDTSKYDALLQLKQGEPFSSEKIAATVDALKKSGDFQDVVLT